MMNTPILPCLEHDQIKIISSSSGHRLQSPTYEIPRSVLPHIQTAATHLREGRTVAFPTETVYGLGAHSLDPEAVRRIYEIKNRPSDNPLIIHVSSLDMLSRLLPPTYILSPLYQALISAFWPGPLTLLFPNPNPPPPPAPNTLAIRMPSHPLALALIHHANLPISAPSANSSGRPSPTAAKHVYHDLNGKEGLGCILDGGECGVGVESTVVNGLGWSEEGGGYVDVLRPGGLGVEAIAGVVREVDGGEGRTEILVHGKPWRGALSTSNGTSSPPTPIKKIVETAPSTPGMKYRHYSPRVPVYLCLPSNTFPRDTSSDAETSASGLLRAINASQGSHKGKTRVGLLHYDNSPLFRSFTSASQEDDNIRVTAMSLGEDATSAAQRLFAGMLTLEGRRAATSNHINGDPDQEGVGDDGVDVILIEGCKDDGLGLAVMERIRKAVGGGGQKGELENGEVGHSTPGNGIYWVDV